MSPIYKKYVTKKRRETATRKRVAERPQPAKPDWETLRPLILAKSDGCYLCGRPLTLETMTTDHVTIEKMGCRKNDATDNLMPCCSECNYFKGSRRLSKGKPCHCGQKFLVIGLRCLRCRRRIIEGYQNSGVRTERTGRFTI